jgi:hypothetical protein
LIPHTTWGEGRRGGSFSGSRQIVCRVHYAYESYERPTRVKFESQQETSMTTKKVSYEYEERATRYFGKKKRRRRQQ